MPSQRPQWSCQMIMALHVCLTTQALIKARDLSNRSLLATMTSRAFTLIVWRVTEDMHKLQRPVPNNEQSQHFHIRTAPSRYLPSPRQKIAVAGRSH